MSQTRRTCLSGLPPTEVLTSNFSCAPGYYCPFIVDGDDSTLPVACPPLWWCKLSRLEGGFCPAQGSHEPELCTLGSYCPDFRTRLECPEGYYCPRGTVTPIECEVFASCPPGSHVRRHYGGLMLAGLLDVLVLLLFIVFRVRHCRKRRAHLRALKEEAGRKRTASTRWLKDSEHPAPLVQPPLVQLPSQPPLPPLLPSGITELQQLIAVEEGLGAADAAALAAAVAECGDGSLLSRDWGSGCGPRRAGHHGRSVTVGEPCIPWRRPSLSGGEVRHVQLVEEAGPASNGAPPSSPPPPSLPPVQHRRVLSTPMRHGRLNSIVQQSLAGARRGSLALREAVARLRGRRPAPAPARSLLEAIDMTRIQQCAQRMGKLFARARGTRSRLHFSFNNLSLHLAGGACILNDVSGVIHPGRVTAIMGPSGAGKTTMMNVLLGNTPAYSRMGGGLRINGVPCRMQSYRHCVGYVPQEDIMLPSSTVQEAVRYSANVRLPHGVDAPTKAAEHVAVTLEALGLQPVAHSVIGMDGARGISGGQRKRVNVGMELVTAPAALFLDEPTSGLDATAALELCTLLRIIAQATGLTVAAVIHQPRREIFQALDDLLLLAPGGRTAYAGPRAHVVQYFQRLGFVVPEQCNPADVLLDIINTHADKVVDAWREELERMGPAGSVLPYDWLPGAAADASEKAAPEPDMKRLASDASGGSGDDDSGSNGMRTCSDRTIASRRWSAAAGAPDDGALGTQAERSVVVPLGAEGKQAVGSPDAASSKECYDGTSAAAATAATTATYTYPPSSACGEEKCAPLDLAPGVDAAQRRDALAEETETVVVVVDKNPGAECVVDDVVADAGDQWPLPKCPALLKLPSLQKPVLPDWVAPGQWLAASAGHVSTFLPRKRAGAGWLRQVRYAHNRAVTQQVREYKGLVVELLASLLAASVIAATMDYDGILYLGLLRAPYITIASAPLEARAYTFAFCNSIGIGMAAAAAGVKVFSPERIVYYREAARGHSRSAYYVGKSLAALYRIALSSLHYAAVVHYMVAPTMAFGRFYAVCCAVYFAVYGAATVTSMTLPAMSATVASVLLALCFAVLSGTGPFLSRAREDGYAFLIESSYSRWAAEAIMNDLTAPFAHYFNVEFTSTFIGFQFGRFWFDILMAFSVGMGWRVLAALAMVVVDRRRQR